MKHLLIISVLFPFSLYAMDSKLTIQEHAKAVNTRMFKEYPAMYSPTTQASKDFQIRYAHGPTPLYGAIINNQQELASALIATEQGLNERDDHGRTPLHWAAEKKQNKIIHELIYHGALVDCRDLENKLPLDLALEKNVHQSNDQNTLDETSSIILRPDIGDNKPNSVGITPLVEAICTDNLTVAKAIITYGKNINYTDQHQRTALHIALARNKSEQVILDLLKADTRSLIYSNLQDNNGKTLLHHIVIRKYGIDLLKATYNLNNNYYHVSKDLSHAITDSSGHTALDKALILANPQAIHVLLPDMLELDFIPDKVQLFRTVMSHDKNNSHLDTFTALLSHIDLNCQDNEGNTPLHFAAVNDNNHSFAVTLLARGADKHAKNKNKLTPLERRHPHGFLNWYGDASWQYCDPGCHSVMEQYFKNY